MKYLLFSIACLFALPSLAFAESITSFTSDIFLDADGTFSVTETIVYDFGETDRHGIFRDIQKNHPQEASSIWKDRSLGISIQEVSIDGGFVPFEISESGSEIHIKIGDPDTTLSGAHTYVISYEVHGGYSYFEDNSAEIYWNVTGHGWSVPIEEASARVRADSSLFAAHTACYTGAYGETAPCEISVEEGVVTFTATNLQSYEGITIAQELNGAILQKVVLEKWKIWLIGLLIAPVLLLGAIFFGYRYRTAHKTGRTIIAEYEPYENFKPMYSGMLFDGMLDPRDITAGIVYLAEQGYLKIRKIERKVLFLFEVDDYEVTLMRPVSTIENDFLRDVVLLMFELHDTAGKTMSLGELKQKQSKQTENFTRLNKLRSDLKADMRKEGFYQVNESFWGTVSFVGGATVLLFVMGILLDPALFVFVLVFVLVGALSLVLFYERRTRRGYEALDHLKGFKLFLSVTDEERFKFHNAPQKSPEQFMQYLPYAIAFGVEKQWAEVFKDITIPDPSWYDGGNTGHFSAVGLTHSLGAFSTAMAASSVSSASSSGGSGGGGFSGGGGGGGGGGSW